MELARRRPEQPCWPQGHHPGQGTGCPANRPASAWEALWSDGSSQTRGDRSGTAGGEGFVFEEGEEGVGEGRLRAGRAGAAVQDGPSAAGCLHMSNC